MIWLVLGAFLLLVVAGVAVAYALGAASVLSFIATDNARYLAILPISSPRKASISRRSVSSW